MEGIKMNVLIDERILKDIAHMLNCLPKQTFNDLNGMVTDTYTIASRLGRVVRDKNPTGLDVYTNGDNDQPTTCPKCGGRTYFVELSKAIQHHQCINRDCGYEFALEVTPEPEEPEVDDSLGDCAGCGKTILASQLSNNELCCECVIKWLQ